MRLNRVPGKQSSGFTLTELMIAVAIIGAILTIALPYFAGVLRRVRLDSAARQFDMILLKARIEAIRRGNQVGVIVSTDSTYDGSTTAKPNAYRSAVVFVDSNANGTFDSTETVLTSYALPSGSSTVTYSIDTVDKSTPGSTVQTYYFVFTPFGSAVSVASGSMRSLYVSDGVGNTIQLGIPVAASGRVQMTKLLTGGGYEAPPWTWY
jgi:type IV fimbrial biogenesis protein FimT